jgi:hypothetical protein
MQTLLSCQQVADELIKYCKEGQSEKAIEALYSDNIVSIESMPNPQTGSKQVAGKDACLQKSKMWAEMNEVHQKEIGTPICTPDHFAVKMRYEVTVKHNNWRGWIEEICVYEVKEGKIIYEHFYYTADPK